MSSNDGAEEFDFSDQVALVTGGGRGLGRAYAQAIAAAGAAVAVTAKTEDQIAETVKLIESAGGRAIAVSAEVSDRPGIVQEPE